MTYWTNREMEQLQKFVDMGKSDAEISALMPGRSKTSIMQKRKYGLGIDQRRHWTPDEDARLKRLLTTTDKTFKEIGRLLSRSENAVGRRKERLGIKWRPHHLHKNNPSDIAQLVKFKLAGWTHEAIAEVFDVHASYISNLLTENGFYRFCEVKLKTMGVKRPIWTELEVHLLRKALKRGYSFEQICMELPRRSKHGIRQKIRQITRYWLSADEKEERKRLREKHISVLRVQ